MIYSYLSDRLGNNLFQISAGYSHAVNKNTQFSVIIPAQIMPNGGTLEENIEKYRGNIFRKITFIPERKLLQHHNIYIQIPGIFMPIPNSGNLELHGFFQDYRYVTEREKILKLFEIDNESLGKINHRYADLLDKNCISVHLRRKDYLRMKTRMELRSFSLQYYERAIDFINSKYPDAVFLFFSDDMDFCKKKFKGDNYYFISNREDYVDLYMMSFCKHNIICNSSFSWWGAWLNRNPNKTVVAPQQWYGIGMSRRLDEAILPPEWIKISNPQTLITYIMDRLYYPYYKMQKFILKIELYIKSRIRKYEKN